jgi:hypothetical protein
MIVQWREALEILTTTDKRSASEGVCSCTELAREDVSKRDTKLCFMETVVENHVVKVKLGKGWTPYRRLYVGARRRSSREAKWR